jgi:hypothetical protein
VDPAVAAQARVERQVIQVGAFGCPVLPVCGSMPCCDCDDDSLCQQEPGDAST